MALVYKKIVSAHIASANTDTIVYTVPASHRVVGQILVCNNNSTSNRVFRLSVVPDSVFTPASKDYLFYNLELLPNETVSLSAITLGAGDSIIVQSPETSSAAGTGITVHLFGELDTLVV